MPSSQMLRREKKHYVAFRADKEEIQVYHRFGESVKHRTKKGVALISDAKGGSCGSRNIT